MSTPGETATGNNSDSDPTTVIRLPDLSITKAHSGSFTVGANGVYTITVANSAAAGPTTGAITVTDTLPAGLTYVSGAGTGWSCGISSQTVTCTYAASLAAGGSAPAITLTVGVGAAAAPSVTNTASVSTPGETATGNNSDSDPTTVIRVPDLSITKVHSGSFTVGANGVYGIMVANSAAAGPTTGAITVTDVLPAGLSFVSGTGTGWSCSNSGQTVTCTHAASLAAGSSAPAINLTVGVASAAAPSVTNTASVATAGEVAAGDNSASDATTVDCAFSISPTSRTHESFQSTGTVKVTVQGGCSWKATSLVDWITVTSGDTGTGNGTVSYSVEPNTSKSSRSGVVRIDGLSFRVIQTGPACETRISSDTRKHGPGAENGRIRVEASSDCIWTATTQQDWIQIVEGNPGTGNGTLSYSVAANPSRDPRTGTIVIGQHTISVYQQGDATPTISLLNPPSQTAGGGDFELTLDGAGFVTGSRIRWNGKDRSTTFLGVSQLRASIPSTDVGAAGSADITVVNPGGGVSNAAVFPITSSTNPVPSLTRLSPSSSVKGGPAFKLTVAGTGFVSGSRILWNGTEQITSFDSVALLSAVIPASALANATPAEVRVSNPAPGGGTSEPWPFAICSGACITDISPSFVRAGSQAFTLTMFGSNFTSVGEPGATPLASSGLAVLWNGQPLATTLVSSTELRAQVPATLVASANSVNISLAGTDGTPNTVPFLITPDNRAPLLFELRPAKYTAGDESLEMTIVGRDFVPGATVLWNGTEYEPEFLDSTEIHVALPVTAVSEAGDAAIRVVNPGPGGGVSNGLSYSLLRRLYFPRLASDYGDPFGTDRSEYTGIAVANLSASAESQTFTAFRQNGELIAGVGITNPNSMLIDPGEQLPMLDFQVFGRALPVQRPVGWFKMETAARDVAGFFLMFNQSLSFLDGADVSSTTLQSIVVPEIEEGGFTQIHAANPNIGDATVSLELYGPGGRLSFAPAIRTIGPSSSLAETLDQLFPGYQPAASDYIRVASTRGVVLFAYLGKDRQYVEGLNGQNGEGGSTTLYSPQYAVGGDWRSTLSIVNLDTRPGIVTLRLIGDGGTQIGETRTVPIAAQGKIHISDQGFFGVPASRLTQGYVEIKSDSVRLTGSVVFGDPGQERFGSALPLTSSPKRTMIFSQVASNDTYFTGLALLNPGAETAHASIEIYDQLGKLLASKVEQIAAGQRVSRLITEYFPDLNGASQSSGYIRVVSDKDLAGFALFGTRDLTALSAVPPQDAP